MFDLSEEHVAIRDAIAAGDGRSAAAAMRAHLAASQARFSESFGPSATVAAVKLRAHRLSWRRDPALPGLVIYGVLATRRVGPFIVRREFAVPAR